ncbi:WGR domain-containing protein [Microvirga sp. 0TCS3.31]
MIERDLFGTFRPVENLGRIGTNGQEKAEEFESEDEADRNCRKPISNSVRSMPPASSGGL